MKYSYILYYILVLIYCSQKFNNHVGWRIRMNGFTICLRHCFLCYMIIFILVIRYHGSLEYMNFDSHHPIDMYENVQSCFHSKCIEVAWRFLNWVHSLPILNKMHNHNFSSIYIDINIEGIFLLKLSTIFLIWIIEAPWWGPFSNHSYVLLLVH